jgi:UDP-N-acetylmuramate dehydrogenase
VYNSILREIIEIVGNESVKPNEYLKNHTSFRIGGPCDYLLIPKSSDQLIKLLKKLSVSNINFIILGNGSNVIVKDNGIRGIVIKTTELKGYKVIDQTIEGESGILMSQLSNIAYQNQLSGLEFASGIPGTLGGAVNMNAGAYDGEMSQVVKSTTVTDKYGNVSVIEGTEHEFGYRRSIIQKRADTIISVKMLLQPAKKEDILSKMQELNKNRSEKQPLEMPSAGSVFKRPEGYFAGKLIMDSGLKGKRIGDAMVSDKHCGFIVNMGNATAKDVLELIEYVKEEVNKKFGILLETEIKTIGE